MKGVPKLGRQPAPVADINEDELEVHTPKRQAAGVKAVMVALERAVAQAVDLIPGVGEDQDRRYYAITIKPTVFVNLVPDHVIIHRMFPMAADHTIVECDWLYVPSVVESGKDVSASVELFHRVNQQDFDACERCQPAMGSKVYAKGGVLVPSEHHIGAFHDWVQEKVGDITPGR